MGKNFNQNNNERKRNFKKRNERNTTKQHKVNELKAQLYLPADLNESIAFEIIDVLNNTRFNKISIPLNMSKRLIDSKDANDTRVTTIGYIRDYDPETEMFTVIVFDNFIESVNSLGDIAMDITFVTYKDKLRNITKFNIIPVIYEVENSDVAQ
jgi:hypothetical protein